MKEIPLTQGKVALVDDADFNWLIQIKWRAAKCRGCWYAKSGYDSYMHREILGLMGRIEGHHKNGNGLDNQRHNLVSASRAKNAGAFCRPRKNKTSQFRGVSWAKHIDKWMAHIRVNYKMINLGYFESEINAAKARDLAAKREFGPLAQLNFN
jgi:hypothetical protein